MSTQTSQTESFSGSAGKAREGIIFSRPTLSKNELKSVLESLVHDEISFGKVVQNYEKESARVFEFSRALSVNSLYAGYHLAFLSTLEEGDEVILPANAPVEALDALSQVKAVPVVVDLSKESFLPSVDMYKEKVSEKTRAVLLYYSYGSFRDFDELRTWLREEAPTEGNKKIRIIEDISYLTGMEYKGQYVGSDADIAIAGLNDDMSMTIGKGALLFTDNKNLYAMARDFRHHGTGKRYRTRFDYTIADYQAAMGLEQLGSLTSVLERRRRIGSIYQDAVKNSVLETWFHSADIDAFGAFAVIADKEIDHTERYFRSLNIETRRTMKLGPLHQMLGLPASDYPNAQKLYDRGLLLPIYPYLTKNNVDRITGSIKGFY